MESYALLQYAVQYEAPQTANASSLSLDSTPQGSATAEAAMLRVATYGRPLKVRSGPGLEYDVVSKLANKTILRASGDYSNGWTKLTSGGWVFSRYTRKVRGTDYSAPNRNPGIGLRNPRLSDKLRPLR